VAPRVRLGALISIALAAGFVTWLLLRPDSGQKAATGKPAAHIVPRLVSPAELHAVAGRLRYPLYWVGTRRDTRYELTRVADGRTFVRYLTGGAKAGDPHPAFLAIGTYALDNAFAAIKAAGRRPGTISLKLTGGAMAVYDRARPTSVYFAYPGSRVQVEVYDPSAQLARGLVLSGRVVPIR
jgi:hypothetical protein